MVLEVVLTITHMGLNGEMQRGGGVAEAIPATCPALVYWRTRAESNESQPLGVGSPALAPPSLGRVAARTCGTLAAA